MNLFQEGRRIKVVLITIFIGLSLSFYANNHIPTKSYFEQLYEVNKEWVHHKDACPKGAIAFHSDLDRIQLHLDLVINYLKLNPPSYLNSKQQTNRSFLLAKLQEYADNKVFPINKYHFNRTPYFVDDIGTNCAVGQMIYVSGHKDLVAKISKDYNYDYIKDIHTKGLKEWAEEYGFTLDELKWIQPTYSPSQRVDQVLDGTNGEVKKITKFNNLGLVIIGDFTELDSMPCLNIGVYKDDQLSCLGTGIDGVINDVVEAENSGEIYVFGELHHNSQVFPIAKFDGTNWSYIGVPGRDGAIATAAYRRSYGFKFQVAINHGTFSHQQEIWSYAYDNTWEKKAKVNGFVLDIIGRGNLDIVYAGHFDSVYVYDANAFIDTTFAVNNVVINSDYPPDDWYGINGEISDTVNVVKEIGSTLIFGGTCSSQSGENNVCMSRYFNSVLQPIFISDYGIEGRSVNTIVYKNGDQFFFGGDFHISPSIGTNGTNLATYNLVNNMAVSIAAFDRPVNSLSYFNNELYMGGDFQMNLGDSINFLGKIPSTAGLKSEIKSNVIPNVYPNPFRTTINLNGVEDGVSYSILYIDGRLAKKGKVLNEKIDQLDFLPKGTYLLQLETNKGAVVKKVFKE